MENNELLQKIEILEKKMADMEAKRGLRGFFRRAFSKSSFIVGIALAAALTGFLAWAAQNTFSDGTVISAADVNANFTELYDDISGLKSKGYIKLEMSASQSVDTGTTVAFDTVKYSKNISSSGNGVVLTAGKTYRIESCLNLYQPPTSGYLGYMFYSNETAIGSGAYSQSMSNTTYNFKAGLLEIYTPTTDVILTVRIVDDNLGSGLVSSSWGTCFMVTEL